MPYAYVATSQNPFVNIIRIHAAVIVHTAFVMAVDSLGDIGAVICDTARKSRRDRNENSIAKTRFSARETRRSLSGRSVRTARTVTTFTGRPRRRLLRCEDTDNFDRNGQPMVSEHIVIADELADHSIEPTRVCDEEMIHNRIKGTCVEFMFYDEGFLRVRETRKGAAPREHLLELRFLSPDPLSRRNHAIPFLWAALALALGASAAAFLLPATDYAQFGLSATAGLATLAIVALLLFIHRSEVKFRFVTASGRAGVLTLTGSFGCIRRMRAVVGAIRQAIRVARQGTVADDADYLRAEMKAHYKLAETGVITRKQCTDGTTLILSKFD